MHATISRIGWGNSKSLLGLADGDSEAPPPMDPLTMIAFEPLGTEVRIVLPDAVGAVVHGRVRLFLTDNAEGDLATPGDGSWLGIAGKPEPVTIYHAIGLGRSMLEELAGMILAHGQPAALYVRLPDGSTGRFTPAGWKARSHW